jgi:hypothetical protein
MIEIRVQIKDQGSAMGVRIIGESDGQTSSDETELATSIANLLDAFTDRTMGVPSDPKLMAIVGPYVPLGRTSFLIMSFGDFLRKRFGKKPKSPKHPQHSVVDFLESLDFEEMRIRK